MQSVPNKLTMLIVLHRSASTLSVSHVVFLLELML